MNLYDINIILYVFFVFITYDFLSVARGKLAEKQKKNNLSWAMYAGCLHSAFFAGMYPYLYSLNAKKVRTAAGAMAIAVMLLMLSICSLISAVREEKVKRKYAVLYFLALTAEELVVLSAVLGIS